METLQVYFLTLSFWMFVTGSVFATGLIDSIGGNRVYPVQMRRLVSSRAMRRRFILLAVGVALALHTGLVSWYWTLEELKMLDKSYSRLVTALGGVLLSAMAVQAVSWFSLSLLISRSAKEQPVRHVLSR